MIIIFQLLNSSFIYVLLNISPNVLQVVGLLLLSLLNILVLKEKRISVFVFV